jgi:hypothetical protein
VILLKGDGWYDLSIDDLISEAIKKRADYQKVTLELENAKSSVSMAESVNMPTISNSLSYNVGGTTPWNILDSRTISFGFNLSIPIFTGYSITANEQIAQIQVKSKQLELSDLQKRSREIFFNHIWKLKQQRRRLKLPARASFRQRLIVLLKKQDTKLVREHLLTFSSQILIW